MYKPSMDDTEKLVKEIISFRGPLLLDKHHTTVHDIIIRYFKNWQLKDGRSRRLNGEKPIFKNSIVNK